MVPCEHGNTFYVSMMANHVVLYPEANGPLDNKACAHRLVRHVLPLSENEVPCLGVCYRGGWSKRRIWTKAKGRKSKITNKDSMVVRVYDNAPYIYICIYIYI